MGWTRLRSRWWTVLLIGGAIAVAAGGIALVMGDSDSHPAAPQATSAAAEVERAREGSAEEPRRQPKQHSDGESARAQPKQEPARVTPEQAPPHATPEHAPAAEAVQPSPPPDQEEAETDPPKKYEVPPLARWSGSGNAVIGTVAVNQLATLRWSYSGRRLVLVYGPKKTYVLLRGQTGTLVIPRTTYDKLRVRTTGRWSLSIGLN